MALQKNSAGFWVNADGHYPVFLFRAHQGDGRAVPVPIRDASDGGDRNDRSPTRNTPICPLARSRFLSARNGGRPLNDDEAAKINAKAPKAEAVILPEPDMSDDDRAALAELEAEERKNRKTISLKGNR